MMYVSIIILVTYFILFLGARVASTVKGLLKLIVATATETIF